MQYRKKPALVEAIQWFRNGDHPQDESTPIGRPGGSSTTLTEGKIVRHMHAGIPGDRVCMECGNVMRRHGIIDGLNGEEETVHPGDYIVTHVKGHFYRRGQKEFEAMFEPFEHVVATTELSPAVDISELEARIKVIEEHFTGQANSDPMNLKTVRSQDLAIPKTLTDADVAVPGGSQSTGVVAPKPKRDPNTMPPENP